MGVKLYVVKFVSEMEILIYQKGSIEEAAQVALGLCEGLPTELIICDTHHINEMTADRICKIYHDAINNYPIIRLLPDRVWIVESRDW